GAAESNPPWDVTGFARLTPSCGVSRPALKEARTRFEHAGREIGDLDQQRPGVARIDDLLDLIGFRRAERRAHVVEPRLDLGHQLLPVLGGVELGAIGGLEPALD